MIYIRPGAVDTDKPSALYENIFAEGVLSGNAAAGFPLENAITGSTWDYWKPVDGAARGVTVTLDEPMTADCLFIDAHNMATVGADYRLDISTDGGANWSNVTGWTVVDDNSPIMVLFPERYGNAWRTIQRNGPASIGVIMLGKRLVFPHCIDDRYTSFQHGHNIEVLGGNSLGGQFLGQKIMRRGGNTSLTFPFLESEWVDTMMSPFETHYNEGKPFAFAANPDFRDTDVAYCWRPDRASELRPTYFEGGKFQDFTMEVDYFVG